MVFKVGDIGPNRGQGRPTEERFWALVKKGKGPDACWMYTGGPSKRYGESKNLPPYGNFRISRYPIRKQTLAHRYSWELHFGPIPRGKQVCHRCDHPKCVRPDHLWLGTHKQNHADCTGKGRRPHLKGEKNGMAKVTEEEVRLIRSLIRPHHGSISEVAQQLNMAYMRVYKIAKRLRWQHVV